MGYMARHLTSSKDPKYRRSCPIRTGDEYADQSKEVSLMNDRIRWGVWQVD